MARVADMRVQSRPRVPLAKWTPEFVEFLQQNHGGLLRLDVAPSTQRVYDTSVRRYMSFCEKLGVQAVPNPPPPLVSQLVLGCTCANFALSTIRVSVAALQRWAADEFGMPGLGYSPLVVRAMKLAARWAVLTTRPKLPLSMGQLQRVVTHCEDLESFVGVRHSAMWVCGKVPHVSGGLVWDAARV